MCDVGDQLYLHGAAGNAMLRNLAGDADVCVTVTLLDGLVFARSAFHHSMNYRCVVLFGRADRVTDEAELQTMAAALLDHLAPGRSTEAAPTDRGRIAGDLDRPDPDHRRLGESAHRWPDRRRGRPRSAGVGRRGADATDAGSHRSPMPVHTCQ